jgi:hypothetical protein
MLFKKENKKAQFNSTLIVILAVLISGVVIIFGYNIIKDNINRQCLTNLNLFEEKAKAVIDGIAHNINSVEEFNYKGLCDVNMIYFVDKDKEVNASEFNETPEIMDDVDSDSKNNVFLMADNEFRESFYVGDIDIPSPYHLCFMVKKGRLLMMLEGKGVSTRLRHKENMFNCGHTIIEPTMEEARGIIKEVITELGEGEVGAGEVETVQKFSETEENIELSREISCSGKDAVIEIEIVPKEGKGLEELKYVEVIPKECVKFILKDSNLFLGSGDFDVTIEADPLIMWKFDDEVDEKEDISYTIKGRCKKMTDCYKILEGIGFADKINKVSNLKKAETYRRVGHSKPKENIKKEIKKMEDGVMKEVPSDRLVHIETKDELEEGDRIIIYLRCDSLTEVSLYEDESNNVVGSVGHCTPGSIQSLQFTIPEGTEKSKKWDLKADELVYYDFITSAED